MNIDLVELARDEMDIPPATVLADWKMESLDMGEVVPMPTEPRLFKVMTGAIAPAPWLV
jgi:hypothetical protein